MFKKYVTICLFIFYIIIFQGNGAGEKNDSLAYLKNNVLHRRLGNGINVIALNRGYSPTVALIISFMVGSADESYETMGAAHMLEHMLFKGTDKIGTKDFNSEKQILDQIEKIGESLDRLKMANPNDKRIHGLEKELKKLQEAESKFIVSSPYDKMYTSIGGVGFNASTSRDMTSYFIELPSGKLEVWAQIESERLKNPVMREYYQERKAVIEERLMRYDSRGIESLFEKFIAVAMLAQPYRHPTIGWASNIKYLSIKDVKEFYRSNYIPSRMTITVVGKQNPEETFTLIEKYFGSIEKREEKRDISIKEPGPSGERRCEVNFDSNPFLIIGWNKPAFPSRDDYICEIIAGVLADGKTSRLYKSLVLDKKIAASVDAGNGYPGSRYDNLFLIEAAPRQPHSPSELEDAIYDEINRLKFDISESEISRVVNRTESSMIFDLESNKGISHMISYYQTVFGDWSYVLKYLPEIKSVTANEVKTALNKYFTRENRTVGILLNKAIITK